MIDFLLQATLSNILIAGTLAIIAWQLQKRIASASLSNLLWALVLVKLITPPVISIPVLLVPSLTGNNAQTGAYEAALSAPADPVKQLDFDSETATRGSMEQSAAIATTPWSTLIAPTMLLAWVLGSVTFLLISAHRVLRFHLLLKANSRAPDARLLSIADQVSRRLGLRSCPRIHVTSANIAPFVWWQQGRTAVVLSKATTQQLSHPDLENILAHEMAHIRRCDHWMRWLEWSCLIVLWWNPLMWLARNQLRLFEEMACDELVIGESRAPMQQYASSLLNMAELLAASTMRPPVVASAIDSGGHLEKRLKAMLNQSWKVPPAMRLTILGLAFCLFPMGLVVAQDFGAIEKRLGGAVEAGEITLEQAFVMMEALRDSVAHERHDAREVKERFRRDVEKVQAAVEAGKLSEEDAERKLAEMKAKIAKESKELQKEARKRDLQLDQSLIESDIERSQALKLRYSRYVDEIKKSLKDGKLSEEDAERKMMEIRKKIEQVQRAAQDEIEETETQRRAYLGDLFSLRLGAAADDGDTFEEEARKRLFELKRKIAREDRAEQEDSMRKELMRRFEFDVKRINSAVEERDRAEQQTEKKAFNIYESLLPNSFKDEPLREKELRIEIRERDAKAARQDAALREAKSDVSNASRIPFTFYLQNARQRLQEEESNKTLMEKQPRAEEQKSDSGEEELNSDPQPLNYVPISIDSQDQRVFSFFMGFPRQ